MSGATIGGMHARTRPWDYLIVTASNERQAEAYQVQLDVRRELGLLSDVRHVLVVADPGGRRIGSGGSTLYCLMEVLAHQLGRRLARSNPTAWGQVLAELRILIVHAGGDSRRLPAYSACGKLFIPVPGENDSAVCLSLFDRQLPTYLALPAPTQGRGQVVITSGDVLLRFDPTQVRFKKEGVTGLTCYAHPQQASRHGVFCCGQDDEVRLYLQKPSIPEQRDQGAIDAYGQSCLDIGVMHFDAATAVRLLELFGVRPGKGDGSPSPAGAGRPSCSTVSTSIAKSAVPWAVRPARSIISDRPMRAARSGRGRCWAGCSGLSRPSPSTCRCSSIVSSLISA